ncbi:hypothetical protein FDP41_012085 [Naegleria fowleri]|uniref:Uncharacterized protein n=1 Tax=Naegleria fowleri TaxID=5763 RepID=A0A6A5C6M8_NAEFO|nr:uncharacterized protein FDP41_012085 [Naegleria fowleri]KAF0981428.1 hypothetical protein FDP41_012085 [Naegleria fowleri]
MFFRKNRSNTNVQSSSNVPSTSSIARDRIISSSTPTLNSTTTTTSTTTAQLNTQPNAQPSTISQTSSPISVGARPSMDILLMGSHSHMHQKSQDQGEDSSRSTMSSVSSSRNRNSLRLSIGNFFKDKLCKIRNSLNRNTNLNFDDIEAAVASEQQRYSPSSSAPPGYGRCSIDTSRTNTASSGRHSKKERGRSRAISDVTHPKKRPVSVTFQQLQSGGGYANPYSQSILTSTSSSWSSDVFPSPRHFFKSSLFSNNKEQESKDIKVLVLGATAVGKSALCSQYLKGIFPSQHVATVEDQFKKVVDIDGETTSIHILDTWGDVLLQNESSSAAQQQPQDQSNSSSSSQTMPPSQLEQLSRPSRAITSIIDQVGEPSGQFNNTSYSTSASSNSTTISMSTSSMAESCTLTDASNVSSSKNSSPTSRRNSSAHLEMELKKSIINQISSHSSSSGSSNSHGSFFSSNVVIILMYSISDYSSFEKVLQIYENLQLLAVESHLKNYNEELANNSKKKGSLTKRSPRCKYYSFQPTILLVGTKRDQDPSIARSNLIQQLSTPTTSTTPQQQEERRPSMVQQPSSSADMYGFYYGFGLSNSLEDKSQLIHSLPARIPITKSNKRRPSIYSQYEYAMCGCTETERQVTFEEGEQLAATIGENCYFMEISNQNPLEVEQVFLQAVRKVRERITQLSNSEFARAARAQPISHRMPLSECVSVYSSRSSTAATPCDEDTWNVLNAAQQQPSVNHPRVRKEVPRLLSPISEMKDEKQRRRRKDIKVLENCAALTDDLINYM